MSSKKICVVVMGQASVGKSAVTSRLINGVFVEVYEPTVENKYRYSVEIEEKVYVLDILDTAGGEGFTALRDLYLRDGHGYMLIYSVNSKGSIKEVKDVYDQLTLIKQREYPHVVLLANKIDLPAEDHQLLRQDGEALSKTLCNCPFFETSAKENINIKESVEALVRSIIKDPALPFGENSKLGNQPSGSKGGIRCIIL